MARSNLLRLLVACLAATEVQGNPLLQPRGTVESDAIVGFLQTVPSGPTGKVYLTYKPYLKVVNGCVPYPAVDAKGNTNAGLSTGTSNSECSSNPGQIYVRGATYNGKYALMYSWYFPEDSAAEGIGHRHDWEGAILWLSDSTATTSANVLAVCPSAHGGWYCSTDGFTLDGTNPLIQYKSIFPVDHACSLTTEVGGQQSLVAWESLPTVAQKALDTTDFGRADVPFIDKHFNANLGNATF